MNYKQSFVYLVIFIPLFLISSTINGFFKTFYFVLFLFPLIYCVENFFKKDKDILYFFSIFYFLLINIFYFFNFKINIKGFYQDFDDSFYYSQATNFLKESYYFDSLFDPFLNVLVLLGADNNFSLISLNWFLSILVLGLISKFSRRINLEFKGIFLLFIGLNMYFIESTVILLRDLLGLFFLLLSFIYIINKKQSFLVFSFLSILVRGSTGIIALIFYMFYHGKYFKNKYKYKYVTITMLLVFLILFYHYIPIGFLTRSGFDGLSTNMTMADFNQSRYERFFGEGGSDVTSKLLSLGILGAPLLLLLNIFTPLSPMSFISDIEYTYILNGARYQILHESVFNYKGYLSLIHYAMIGFMIIPFFNGLLNIFKKYGVNFLILIFFTCLVLVTYVSFQPRHKLHFLIFIPLICSYTNLSVKKIVYYGILIECILFILYLFKNFELYL